MFRTLVLTATLAAATLAACPDRWVASGSSCYWLSSYTASWREARSACTAMGAGGDLMSVQSDQESALITNVLHASDAWIGLNDLDSENNFVWSDGSPLHYVNWADGQPNNLLDQDCVSVLEDGSGRWDDNHCVEKKDFICKMPI